MLVEVKIEVDSSWTLLCLKASYGITLNVLIKRGIGREVQLTMLFILKRKY